MVLTAAEYSRGVGAFNEIVAIDVGPEKQRAYVSKKLLCHDSDFFKSATSSRWRREQPIDLTDEDISVFATFVDWLHERRVGVYITSDGYERVCTSIPEIPALSREIVDKVDAALVAAYQFGQRRLAAGYQDAIISSLVLRLIHIGRTMSTSNVTLAFESTTAGSPLRRLIVTHLVWQEFKNKEHLNEVSGHPDFFMELSSAQGTFIRDRRYLDKSPQAFFHDTCQFHMHGINEDCPYPCRQIGLFESDSGLLDDWGDYLEYTVGPRKEALYRAVSKNASIPPSKHIGPASTLRLPEPSTQAVEICLQIHLMRWKLVDIVEYLVKDASREREDTTFMTLVDIYHVCLHRLIHEGNEGLLCAAVDAVAHWVELVNRLPCDEAIDHAYRLLAPREPIIFKEVKLLHLLAMFFAWSDERITTENVQCHRVIAVAQASIICAYKSTAGNQQYCMVMGPPWEGINLCRWYHTHDSDLSQEKCRSAKSEEMRRAKGWCKSRQSLHEDWSWLLHRDLWKRIEGFSLDPSEEGDGALANVDGHFNKRLRTD